MGCLKARFGAAAFFGLACWLFGSCAPAPKLDPLVFQMDWTHQAEYSGFYAGMEKGYFASSGLDLKLLEAPPGYDTFAELADRRADLALMGFTQFVEARKKDPDLIAIMAVFQISPRVLMSLVPSGISGPRDLPGKSVAVKTKNWSLLVKRILTNAGIDPAVIREVQVRPDEIDRFYDREIDVWTGFATSEAVQAQLAGHPVQLIFADDYGAGGYEALIVVRRPVLEAKRVILGRFLKALVRGWAYAAAEPESMALILDRWQPEGSHEFHLLSLKAILPLVDTGRHPIGWIEDERWRRILGADYTHGNPGFTMELWGIGD